MRSIKTALLASAVLVLVPATVAEADPAEREVRVYETMVSLEITGMVGSYSYTIHDEPDGPVVGRTVGYCQVFFQDPGSGDLYSFCDDTMTFHGGTLRSFGVIDMTTAYRGVPITLAVTGGSGPFAGRFGTRYWVAQAPRTDDSRSQIVTATSDFTFVN
ncbi:hypothetical protein DFR70_12128 [Nocardia tenerifensis]|uniref:Allene oxide cyclase barrel-like domain-containing protein n=1 Tax=Nocardia tenerifensis TaxID=228006 RepID=A0A318JTK0_9NOCA|nr:hypothetical protein [Nocardia tenerifensis]PXX55559.1 hypothetical protein DFR70_12128 [Nocardia tenerifensis]